MRVSLVWDAPTRENAVEGSTSDGAYDQFFEVARRQLVGQAFLLTGDFQEAQDLVQEVLVRAWQHWDRLATFDDPLGWAQHVLHNLAVSRWRRQRLRRPQLRGARSLQVPPPGIGHLDVIAAMNALPANQRSALVLRAVGGLSTSEIATELKTSPDTVRVWLSRARATISVVLERPATAVPKGGAC